MPEMLAVGLEAATVILALTAACLIAGYGLTRLLAPPDLRATGFLLGSACGRGRADRRRLCAQSDHGPADCHGSPVGRRGRSGRLDGTPGRLVAATAHEAANRDPDRRRAPPGDGSSPPPACTVRRDVGTEHRRRPVRAPGRGPQVEQRLHAGSHRGSIPGRVPEPAQSLARLGLPLSPCYRLDPVQRPGVSRLRAVALPAAGRQRARRLHLCADRPANVRAPVGHGGDLVRAARPAALVRGHGLRTARRRVRAFSRGGRHGSHGLTAWRQVRADPGGAGQRRAAGVVLLGNLSRLPGRGGDAGGGAGRHGPAAARDAAPSGWR